jgi:hypothetical protein
MLGCLDGYVLLVTPRWNTKKVAVYDPLTGALCHGPAPAWKQTGQEEAETPVG